MHQICSPAGYLPAVVQLPRERLCFAAAAFGADPRHDTAALPVPVSAGECWLAAVALGGQGRYAAARAQLAVLSARFGLAGAGSAGPVLGALALSTEASLWRQLGWHQRAAACDGRALAVALAVPASVPARCAPVCDALTGLAADALGIAGPDTAARLLKRCRTFLDDVADAQQREWLRWHWVMAETALATPTGGATAVQHADAALAIAARGPSIRHRVKSRLLRAATAATTDPDRARTQAAQVMQQAGAHGLLPLQWAGALLRSGLAAGPEQDEASQLARLLLQRGGPLRGAAPVLGKF